MWSAVGVVFDCASKRSMIGRMQGGEKDAERRRGVESEISEVSIAHLEVNCEVEGEPWPDAGGLRAGCCGDSSDGCSIRTTLSITPIHNTH